jgi:hypothetical protein
MVGPIAVARVLAEAKEDLVVLNEKQVCVHDYLESVISLLGTSRRDRIVSVVQDPLFELFRDPSRHWQRELFSQSPYPRSGDSQQSQSHCLAARN